MPSPAPLPVNSTIALAPAGCGTRAIPANDRLRPLADMALAGQPRSMLHDAMFIERAFIERESLSDRDLERLRAGLSDQVQRYEDAIRNYPPDRMVKYGRPFLAGLVAKVAEVDALIARRASVG